MQMCIEYINNVAQYAVEKDRAEMRKLETMQRPKTDQFRFYLF